MGLAYKPDLDQALKRMDAFWQGELLDRPSINVSAPNGDVDPHLPTQGHVWSAPAIKDWERNLGRNCHTEDYRTNRAGRQAWLAADPAEAQAVIRILNKQQP